MNEKLIHKVYPFELKKEKWVNEKLILKVNPFELEKEDFVHICLESGVAPLYIQEFFKDILNCIT